ncbi:glycosyltransferase, partial [Mesorhizobium sp. M3A.F.Ca.ET.174.01.1.1]
FGLVMIEALACGTPVIAFDHGAAREIVEHGVTGFLVDSVDEAVAALTKIDSISRAACRAAFERRFTVERMVDQYLDIYEAMVRAAQPLQAG